MEYIKERVAYLKGLAAGVGITEDSGEGKVLLAILEVLEDISIALEDISEVQVEHEDMLDDLDMDLANMEELIHGGSDGDDFDIFGPEDFDDDGEGDSFSVLIECPHCYGVFTSDKSLFDENGENIECIHCHKKIEVEWVDDDHHCDHCDGPEEE